MLEKSYISVGPAVLRRGSCIHFLTMSKYTHSDVVVVHKTFSNRPT